MVIEQTQPVVNPNKDIREIPINSINLWDFDARPVNERHTPAQIDTIAASITKGGNRIINMPPVVIREVNGKKVPYAVEGRGRIQAWQKLGNDRIRVQIFKESDNKIVRLMALMGNVVTKTMRPGSVIAAIEKCEKDGFDLADLGYGKATINAYKQVRKMLQGTNLDKQQQNLIVNSIALDDLRVMASPKNAEEAKEVLNSEQTKQALARAAKEEKPTGGKTRRGQKQGNALRNAVVDQAKKKKSLSKVGNTGKKPMTKGDGSVSIATAVKRGRDDFKSQMGTQIQSRLLDVKKKLATYVAAKDKVNPEYSRLKGEIEGLTWCQALTR